MGGAGATTFILAGKLSAVIYRKRSAEGISASVSGGGVGAYVEGRGEDLSIHSLSWESNKWR